MQITIDDSKLSGLIALVSRANAVEGADQTTPEVYLTDRINDLLSSYDKQEIDRVKAENAAFFDLAATLPTDKQEQLKVLVQQLAQV